MNEYMDIFCPQFDLDTPREQMLKFAVYNVSKDTFHDCNFVKEDYKKILVCDHPQRAKKLTIKFQKYSPNPLGFTYQPNKSYFFMAVPWVLDTSMTSCDDVTRMQLNVHPRRHHYYDKAPTVTEPPSEHPHISTISTTTATTTKSTTKAATRRRKFELMKPVHKSTSDDREADEPRILKTVGVNEFIMPKNSSSKLLALSWTCTIALLAITLYLLT